MFVSVLINNYNYARYLDYCIESVLSQTYHDIEVILYDDGSTDDSLAVARKYEDKMIVIAENNYGHGHCFNQINAVTRALEVAKGEIICLLDSDDAFHPQKVELVVEEFKNDDSVVLVQHRFQDIDEQNQTVKILRRGIFQNIDHMRAIYFTQRLDYFFMPTSALSFRRSYMEEVLPMPVDQYDKVVIDIRMTRQAIFYGRIRTIDLELGQYRLHTQSYTGRTMNREYLKSLNVQNYEYFNAIARARGHPPLYFSPGVLWKVLTTVRFLLYLVISGDTSQQKRRILWGFVKHTLYRLKPLRRTSSYGPRA